MTAARDHRDLHELVDQLSREQADAVRAVVVQFLAPGADLTPGHTSPATGKPQGTRRRLSFAGTLSAEPDLAERADGDPDEMVTGNAG